MYWSVPAMWPGRTVAVLASGPSMSQAVADKVKHLPRITVNTTYRLALDADIIYACDEAWWKANPEAVQCGGIKVAMEALPGKHPEFPEDVKVLRNTGREGFDPFPDCLRTHNNGGIQAVQVAVHAGAARILLLGFDMRGGHWHEAHPNGDTSDKQFLRWIDRARGLAKAPVDIVNCTEGSALDCFRRESLDDVLSERLAA